MADNPTPPAADDKTEAETKLKALIKSAIAEDRTEREAEYEQNRPKGLLETLFGK